jgi:hypothetical protein
MYEQVYGPVANSLRVIGWSIILIVVMCLRVHLQSTSVLSWMVP